MSSTRNVLVATDLSERAARAETRAAILCADQQCDTLELLIVKEAGLPDSLARVMNSTPASAEALLVDRTVRQMQPVFSRLQDNYGVRCAHTVRFGHPAAEIVSRADEMPADLTVIGAHGGNFFTDIFLGNTADKMIRMSRRPLLVVKNEPEQAYRKILVPVDFSEDSLRAAHMALRIAPDAHITFLHAFDVWFEGEMQYANVSQDVINQYRVQAHEQARQEMNQFISDLEAGDWLLSRTITYGLPAPVIHEHATVMKPDLIVMGKHGRSRIEELLIGSVTRETIHRTPYDILVVPASAGG